MAQRRLRIFLLVLLMLWALLWILSDWWKGMFLVFAWHSMAGIYLQSGHVIIQFGPGVPPHAWATGPITIIRGLRPVQPQVGGVNHWVLGLAAWRNAVTCLFGVHFVYPALAILAVAAAELAEEELGADIGLPGCHAGIEWRAGPIVPGRYLTVAAQISCTA